MGVENDTRTDEDIEQEAINAFDEGVKAAGFEVETEDDEQTDERGGDEHQDDERGERDDGKGDDEPLADDQAKPGDAGAKPNDQGDEEKPPEVDEAVEKEITDMGLKEASAERFRSMARSLKDKDGEIAPLKERAARADQWEQTVAATGAPPQAFGESLRALADAHSDDPEQLNRAWAYHQQMTAELAKKLGKATADYDPISEHPDLREAVEEGDMTEKFAREIAERRAAEKRSQEHGQRAGQEAQARQVMRQALADVDTLSAELAEADPDFEAKLAQLGPTLKMVKAQVAPNQWAATIRRLFAETKIEGPGKDTGRKKPAVGRVPVRPGGGSAGMTREPENEEDAFDMGLAQWDGRARA